MPQLIVGKLKNSPNGLFVSNETRVTNCTIETVSEYILQICVQFIRKKKNIYILYN